VSRLEKAVEREARRLIVRHEAHLRRHAEEQRREQRRSLTPRSFTGPEPPTQWTVDRGFDPYYVRSRASNIAYGLGAAIAANDYMPRPPVTLRVPRDGREEDREVSIYQVADSALSRLAFVNLLKKNAPLASGRSYAYRGDLTTHDAVRHVRTSVRGRTRIYIAEYDFSGYFDNIDHSYLFGVLREFFFVSKFEWQVIKGFLATAALPATVYNASDSPKRQKGIPQGTSISLFLANAAAWEMDRALEEHGVGFARYADDVLIWSKDYASIADAAAMLYEHAAKIGVSVNVKKSHGIRLLTPQRDEGHEITATNYVEYLGYKVGFFSPSRPNDLMVGIKDKNVRKIKQRIGALIYSSLLRAPMLGLQDPERVSKTVDRDYVMALSRIRRYLYGELSERSVRQYGSSAQPLKSFKGVMSAYYVVDDTEGLAALDLWLETSLTLAIKKRGGLLRQLGTPELPPPHDLSLKGLRNLVVTTSSGAEIDLSIPSFRRISRATRRLAREG
jgi:hypothetical protein